LKHSCRNDQNKNSAACKCIHLIANKVFLDHQSQKKCNLIEKFDYYINQPISTTKVRRYAEGYSNHMGKYVRKQWQKLAGFKSGEKYNKDKTILRKQVLAYVNGIDKCSNGTHTVTIYDLIIGALQWKRFINFEETVKFLKRDSNTPDTTRLEKCHILIDIMWFEMGALGRWNNTHLEKHEKNIQKAITKSIDDRDKKREENRQKGLEKDIE